MSQLDVTDTDYMGGFQYVAGKLSFFPHAEGYVDITVGRKGTIVYNYVYQYKDHLGNNRLSFAKDPYLITMIGDPVPLTILEENHYYPFGLKHTNYNTNHYEFVEVENGNDYYINVEQLPAGGVSNYKYKYNGKELQDELGLNMYDYGARNYDPALGRWMNIDPKAEMSRRWTPYNYAYNNPMYFVDPDGMLPVGGDPIKKITSSTSLGNMNPTNVSYTNKCLLCGGHGKTITPTSNNSSGGYKIEYSQMEDKHSTFYNFATEGGSPEFIHSVSISVSTVNSQYVDANGNMVDNIKDASSLVVTNINSTSTIEINGAVISDKVTTSTSTSTTTYDVTRKADSKLERGYELVNGNTTTSKPTMATSNSETADPTLKQNAVKAAKENFKEYANESIDRASENFKASEKRFWESIKKF